ncbi:hypothetical protein HOLleu_11624 [Holothuria leucospilota]|uniref:Uncharacterized protein n=1 Tax=Holothuria leucospilota TaxID=206669 RepID=A0A9Q1CFW8_HOLLE|nr:hypothetical protein HOLleu_11624 [Holothuria leucospilota]
MYRDYPVNQRLPSESTRDCPFLQIYGCDCLVQIYILNCLVTSSAYLVEQLLPVLRK